MELYMWQMQTFQSPFFTKESLAPLLLGINFFEVGLSNDYLMIFLLCKSSSNPVTFH